MAGSELQCRVCAHTAEAPEPADLGHVRGNTRRFKDQLHRLWRCPACGSIQNIDAVDFGDLYRNYPLNQRRLDVFGRVTLRSLLKRLEANGLGKSDRILDYGCGNGLFVHLLRQGGYSQVTGYDPYVAEFSEPPEGMFDWVIANDVIEHAPEPWGMLADIDAHLRPRGRMYIGTPDTRNVDMSRLEEHITKLHQPFHRFVLTDEMLKSLADRLGYRLISFYSRSYLDTPIPFANYRFLDEFSGALGHELERTLDPDAGRVLLHKPWLLLYAFFGYFLPKAYEPAVILEKPGLANDARAI